MPTPSLILVPARFKTGKLYTPVATTSGGTVLGASGDFNVTRATTATRVNASGLIEVVASGIPRLDYPLGGGCPALLVEPSGSNLARQSEDFTTTWTAVNTTPTANQTTSPDNTLTADRISITSNNGYIRQLLATSNSTTYTASCFVKNDAVASGDTFRFYFNNNLGAPNAAVANATININAGTVSTGSSGSGISSVSTGIENYGNGWYRVRITFTLGASAGNASSEIGFEALTATRTFFAWGAQLETGSVATSYIPTTTGTGSRSADVISVTGAVSGSIGQQSGTIYCEFQFNTPTVSTAGILGVESTNNQNRVLLWHNLTNNALAVQLRANNSNVFNTSIGTLTNGQIYKIAIGYSSGNTKVYLNGNSTAVITNTSAYTMAAALSRICLGNYENSAGTVTVSRILSFALYAERLTDAEMIALTTL